MMGVIWKEVVFLVFLRELKLKIRKLFGVESCLLLGFKFGNWGFVLNLFFFVDF